MLFVGDDWAEDHHDIEIQNEAGQRLARARLPEGVAGLARFHALIADHLGGDEDPSQVVVGIETDRGPWVGALVATGYQVYAINPLSAARYRERHVTSRAKSDPGDARVLADLVRTDRHHHRTVAADSDLAEAVKVLARTHQNLAWARQRHANLLRSTLREFHPAALVAFDDLASRDALAVLAAAPTPAAGRALTTTRIAALLRRAGRQRRADTRAEEIRSALRGEQLTAPTEIAQAFGHTVIAVVAVLTTLVAQIDRVEAEMTTRLHQHPHARIYLSLPGFGPVLAARALGEFGDDPNRYETARARRNYAGTSPITRASGKRRVVLARVAVNSRLRDALATQAFAALKASPGARAYYDSHRARGMTHHQALRALANRHVAILHGCLRHQTAYDEATAWPALTDTTQTAAA
ncbi:transposase IS111A/IS1328/IS1533 [Parafrankia sp. EAN1pec]|uniref:IS110 family transposase n=1 Tax=Parafrankia sp. (strain EAN1pec) TaxID=298653 RepID=UPI0000544360|nr:transposase IS111A/IS1328/IS1533 [Frankia sp. EAN1pec]